MAELPHVSNYICHRFLILSDRALVDDHQNHMEITLNKREMQEKGMFLFSS